MFVSRLGNEYPAPSYFTASLPGDVDLDGEIYGGRRVSLSREAEAGEGSFFWGLRVGKGRLGRGGRAGGVEQMYGRR